MKIKMLSLISLFLVSTMFVFGQNKTEKFEVKGNCGMCKSKIEKAAMSVKGVVSAEWNKDTKIINVSYDPAKTNLDKVQDAISKSGYDTPKYKADEKAYKKLPECCQYKRT